MKNEINKNDVMEAVLESLDNIPNIHDVVEASVIRIDKNDDKLIYLDLQANTEGLMYINEYTNDPEVKSFKGLVKKGDKITAIVQKITDEPTQILLSRKSLLKEEAENEIVDLCKEQKLIKGKIKEFNKGGALILYKNFEIFAPFSNLDFEIVNNKEEFINKEIEFIIQEANFKRRMAKIIATRRPIFEEEKRLQQEELNQNKENELMKIKEGDIVDGTVVDVKEYAAIVKLNYVTGLLRISQVSHLRIKAVSDYLKVGDQIKVKVLKKDGHKLDLSLKALTEKPFDKFVKTADLKSKISCKIISKMPFGFFIEIIEGLKGLLPKSEFAWDPKDNFGTQAKVGDLIDVKVLQIDETKEQVTVSRKALYDNPWASIEVKKCDNIDFIIKEFLDNRVVISALGVDGFIKNSEMDCKKNPSEVFKLGESLKGKVVYVNNKTWVLELSVKKLNEETLAKEVQDATILELSKKAKK